MKKTKVEFIEIVTDTELKRKERQVADRLRRILPQCGPVKLYRTADGRIGFQMQVAIAAGERKRLDEIYRVIMRGLGSKRGRPRGVETVQTKLNLPKPVYAALKDVAQNSNKSMSMIVSDSIMARFQAGLGKPPRMKRAALKR